MRKNKLHALFTLLAAVLCIAAFSVTAFADGGDYHNYELPVEVTIMEEAPVATLTPSDPAAAETPAPVQTPAPESDTPEESGGDIMDFLTGFGDLLTAFTPDGNLSLIDDFDLTSVDEDGARTGKQFITVRSKNGNYFYIIIDRAGDEENVYFLNMVDEADLFALMEGGEAEEAPPACICTDHCYAGHVNMSCPVCAVDLTQCRGIDVQPEPTPEPEPESEPEPEKAGKSSAALGLVLFLLLGGAGGAVYYFKFRKPKADTKGPVNLDDYDYGDEDDEEELEYAADEESEDESEGEDNR